MRWCFLLLFSCLWFLTANTQPAAFTFTNYTTIHGLANNGVNSILQDSRGFMWFGTREGLSRFDGTNFKNFFAQKNDTTALPGNSVGYLHEYAPGHLLMICASRLTSMNTITQQFYQPKEFRNKVVHYTSRLKNNLYTASIADTCFIANEQLQIVDTIAPPFKTPGRVPIVTWLSDQLWLISTSWEYFLYSTADKKYKSFLEQKDMLVQQGMLFFHLYDQKNKWLYLSNYYNGLLRYSLEGKLLYNWKKGDGPSSLQDMNISFVKPKNDTTLWVGGYENGGLNILNTLNNVFTPTKADNNSPSSLVSNSISLNYTDRDGNEWIATTHGVSKLGKSAASTMSWENEFPELTSNNVLLSIRKGSDRQMYLAAFGTPYGYKINSADDKVTILDKTKLLNIWCMNTFGDELIFTGGTTTITKFNPLTGQYRQTDFLKKYFPASDIVVLAFKHSNGDEWYSGNNGGGLVRVDAKDGSIHHYRKDGPRGTFSISYYSNYTEDKNGDVWFGVNKTDRLLHWNIKTDYFNEISLDTVKGTTGISFAGISDITLGQDNNIWVAFDGAGIVRYDPLKNVAVHYSIQDGLPTNYVYALKFDNKNRLWIGTLKGLSCLLTEENRFVNFSREDGLPADYFDERCIYYDSSNHQLWIGSKNTLMRFDPDILLSSSKKQLPVYIDEISVNGKYYRIENLTNISFSPLQNNLQFRFIGLDINSGKDIEYSYRLKGADNDWIYNNNITTASYANLNPGRYTFTVRARHKGDIEWSAMQLPVSFTIRTPWHKTWWWRLLLVFIASAAVWFIIRSYYLRKLEQQKAILGKQQAVEKERTRIATDMHDDFGASLSRIKFLSEKMQLQKNDTEKVNEDLGKISAYSDEMAEKMGEIVWALNQRYDSSGDLVSFCRSYASEYLEDKNIKLHFESSNTADINIKGEIRRNIFLVIKESLHNVVKHAKATEVKISIHCDKELRVLIQDNGKGFDTSSIRPFANGIENMKKRIEEIGGHITIQNSSGTMININIDTGIQQNTYR